VKDALATAGFKAVSAEITLIPSLMVELDKEGAEKILSLIDTLEDLDDVQNVFTNADISNDIMEQLG
jgi:transcriptional/translational regulatory protein YebC/TACO1